MVNAPALKGNRWTEIDYLKVMAILLMPLEHCVECFSYFDEKEMSPVGFFQNSMEFSWEFLCTNIFVITIGLGMALTRKSTVKGFLHRAANLFLLGVLLNFLRDVLTYLILCVASKEEFDVVTLINSFFNNDILIFAAMAYLLTALLMKLKIPYVWFLPIGLLLQLVNGRLVGISIPDGALPIFIRFFTNFDGEGFFALFEYYAYVAFGFLVGKYLINRKPDHRAFVLSLMYSLTLIAAFYLGEIIYGIDSARSYDLSRQSPSTLFNLFPSALIMVFFFSLFHFLHQKIGSGKVENVISFLGKDLNTIYCVHWLLIMWICTIFQLTGVPEVSFEIGLIYGFVVLGVSIFISKKLPQLNLSNQLLDLIVSRLCKKSRKP